MTQSAEDPVGDDDEEFDDPRKGMPLKNEKRAEEHAEREWEERSREDHDRDRDRDRDSDR